MKHREQLRIWIPALLAGCLMLLLPACSTDQTPGGKTGQTPGHADTAAPQQADGLYLNQGARWKAEAHTHQQALAMLQKLESAKPEALGDYVKIATELQQSIDRIFQECTMTGEAHEVLHSWLVPLIAKVRELKESTDLPTARQRFAQVSEWIHLYPQYFEADAH